MGWAYGIDLRQRVVDAIEAGMSHRQASERFCVAISTAGNWHRLWRATGSAEPGKECRVTIDELRTWLKVPDDKYPDWKNFRHRVLRPAIDQINADPLGAGFSVEYEPIRKGRFYHEIVFKLEKTKARIATDRTIKTHAKAGRSVREAKAAGRPYLSPKMIENAREETRHFLDMDVVQREFWEHWEATGRLVFKKGVGSTFTGFAKKKYGQIKYGKK